MKFLVKILTALSMICAVVTNSSAQEIKLVNPQELRVLVNPIYPPMEFINPDTGEMNGFDIDLATVIAEQLGLSPIFIASAFADLQSALQTGRGDVIISGMSDNVERQEVMDFVDYMTAGPIFFTLTKNIANYQSRTDVCGRIVAASRSTSFPNQVEKWSDENCVAGGRPAIDVHGTTDSNAARLGMKQGRYDVVVQGIETIAYQMRIEPDTFSTIGEPLVNDDIYGMGFKKDNPALRDKIASILDDLIEKGTYQQLLEKWGLTHNAVEKAVINGAK